MSNRRNLLLSLFVMCVMNVMSSAADPQVQVSDGPSKTEGTTRFRGIWTGECVQEGISPARVVIEIAEFEAGKVSGHVKFSAATVSEGDLIGISADGQSIRVFESIKTGREAHSDGLVELRIQEDDTLRWMRIDPASGQKNSKALLKRLGSETFAKNDLPGGDKSTVRKDSIDPFVAENILVLNDPDKGRNSKDQALERLIRMKDLSAPAVPAIDGFIKSLPDDDSDKPYMISKYAEIGHAAVPTLMAWVKTGRMNESISAIECLGKIGVEANAASELLKNVAVENIGSFSESFRDRNALEVAREDLRRRNAAIMVFRKIGIPAESAVPLLKGLISIPPFASREIGRVRQDAYDQLWVGLVTQAVKELGRYGEKSQPAVDQMISLLETIPHDRRTIRHPPVELKRELVWTLGRVGHGANAVLPQLRLWLADPKVSSTIGEEVLEGAIAGIRGTPQAQADRGN